MIQAASLLNLLSLKGFIFMKKITVIIVILIWATMYAQCQEAWHTDVVNSTTLGQLTKLSQLVVTGTVEISTNDSVESYVDIAVSEPFLGPRVVGSVRIHCASSIRIPSPGSAILVFASKHVLSSSQRLKALHWQFDESSFGTAAGAEWELVGGQRGIIELPSNERQEISKTVVGYIACLRKGPRDTDVYLQFLSALLKSTVPRIQMDARGDLILLTRYADEEKIRQYLKDGLLPEGVQAYAARLLDSRTQQKLDPQLHGIPDAQEIEILLGQLSSKDRSKQVLGMSMITSKWRAWANTSRYIWVHQVARLLDDEDRDIRLAACGTLALIQDQRVIPILIEEGLTHESLLYRELTWGNLKQVCGEPVGFDPRADSSQRMIDVERWRSWWEQNKDL